MVRMVVEVVAPKKIEVVTEVTKAVEDWGKKVMDLFEKYGQTLNPVMKMGVWVGMVPLEIQEYILKDLETSIGRKSFEIKENDLKEKMAKVKNFIKDSTELGWKGESGNWGSG